MSRGHLNYANAAIRRCLHSSAYPGIGFFLGKYLNVFWVKADWCTIRMNQYMENISSAHDDAKRLPNTHWRTRGIFAAFIAVFFMVHVAAAVEDACPGQKACANGTVMAPGEAPRSMRESIDNARDTLGDKLSGLQLSAFGDVASQYDAAGKQKLDWGTLELDAEAELGDGLQAALALVNDATGTTMPVAFFDYHTSGALIAPRGRLWVEKGVHLQVGRFDVPFGNDWQFFASKDSVSISRPLTTELVMDGGYNDEGIRVLGNTGAINFNAYLLHGFNAGRLVGARVGLTPFSDPFSLKTAKEPKTFEFGLSYFFDANTSWEKNETGYAADAEVFIDDWSTRFEYVTRRKEPSPGAETRVLRAWHLTQEYLLDEDASVAWPTTVFARYEQGTLEPPEIASLGADAGDVRDVRVAAGVRTNLGGSDVFQLKFEVQHYREATPATREMPGFGRKLFWYTQLVVVL
jgi:hypothetical protein